MKCRDGNQGHRLAFFRRLVSAGLMLLLILGSQVLRAVGTELDEAPSYILEAWQAPIEAEVIAFDVGGSPKNPLCLVAAGKSVFLLQAKRKAWRTIDVIQPPGRSISAGFIEAPTKDRIGKKDAVRFFVSGVHNDGRIQTTFYVTKKGRTVAEGQTTGKVYRRVGPVLFSQKVTDEGLPPVVVEMALPGIAPKTIGKMELPEGTGLFEFTRLGDAEQGEIARIEKDEGVTFWSGGQSIARLEMAVAKPPLEIPERMALTLSRWRVPPIAGVFEGRKDEEIVVAINDPDVEGGFLFRATDHRSRLAILAVTGEGGARTLKLIGATPVLKGSIPAMAVVDNHAVVAVVDADSRRTKLFRVVPASKDHKGKDGWWAKLFD